MSTPPTCFISYSWDSNDHQNWVRGLAERLQTSGVQTSLDQWDLQPGADVLRYMEHSIASADFVTLICTPTFGQKANSRRGGVGYEQAIVTAELFTHHETTKFIPVLRHGPAVDALPLYLRSRIYIDFTDDSQFEPSLEDLLRVIHGTPAFTRPPLGPAPSFASPPRMPTKPDPKTTPPPTAAEFKNLVEFAFGSHGLNLPSKARAAEWAEQWLLTHSMNDFGLFAEVVRIIAGHGGSSITDPERAAEVAERFTEQHGKDGLVPFRDYVDYAYKGDGLNLPTRVAAAEWALRQLGKHRSA